MKRHIALTSLLRRCAWPASLLAAVVAVAPLAAAGAVSVVEEKLRYTAGVRRIALVVGFLGLCGALLPVPALGATATARTDEIATFVEYRAAPGEANSLWIFYGRAGGSRRETTFRDSGAGITPGPGCRAVTPNEVTCPEGEVGSTAITVIVGDQNDTVTAGEVTCCPDRLDIAAGDGDDVLVGGAADEDLIGGPGDDRLEGGDGDFDFLRGGAGADILTGGRGEHDRASYDDRANPVYADLDGLPDDGEAGEGDLIARSVEALAGGRGNDRLTGDVRDNHLFAGLGADVVTAGGGDDQVFDDNRRTAGERGLVHGDVVYAGSGDDYVGAGGDDKVFLGRGNDYGYFGRGDQRVFGGAGNDEIDTGPGDDVLAGGLGRDRLIADGRFGGSGRDTLYACDGERDRLYGGRGRDRAFVDQVDRVVNVEALLCEGLAG